MPEKIENQEQHLDDLAAKIADQIISDVQADEVDEMDVQDPQILELKNTMLELRQMLQDSHPDPDMEVRIRSRLFKEWHNQQAENRVQNLRRSMERWRQMLGGFSVSRGAAMVVTSVLLVISMLVFSPLASGKAVLAGAASGDLKWLSPVFLVVIVGGLVLLWFFGRKR